MSYRFCCRIPGRSSVGTFLLNSTELCVSARGQLAECEPQMLQRRETGSSQSGADHPNQGKKTANRSVDRLVGGFSCSQQTGVCPAARTF